MIQSTQRQRSRRPSTSISRLIDIFWPPRPRGLSQTVIDSVICGIENLMPNRYPVCSGTYLISKDEMSLLNWSICGQTAHTQCLHDLFEILQDKRDTSGPENITKNQPLQCTWNHICACIYVWSAKNRQCHQNHMPGKGTISRNLIGHNLSLLALTIDMRCKGTSMWHLGQNLVQLK